MVNPHHRQAADSGLNPTATSTSPPAMAAAAVIRCIPGGNQHLARQNRAHRCMVMIFPTGPTRSDTTASQGTNAADEISAFGLRHPRRLCFDRAPLTPISDDIRRESLGADRYRPERRKTMAGTLLKAQLPFRVEITPLIARK
jgi:hypothetical protein